MRSLTLAEFYNWSKSAREM